MKINEIVNEGIWDTIKSGAGKIKQGVQNIRAAGQARQANNAQQTVNKSVVGSALKNYNQLAAQLGGKMSVEQALAWYEKFAGRPATTLPTDTSPGSIQRWLGKEIPSYIANKAKEQIPAVPVADVPSGTFTSNRTPTISKVQPTAQPTTAKTAKPKVPYSAIQQPAKVSPPTNPGAPTPAEQAKLQQKIQAAMQAQQP
jgi:hypothetical protein